MIPEVETIVFDSEAIDALSLTSRSVAGRAMIAGVYKLFAEETEELAFQKNWNALGYKGLQCKSVRWGSRLDGSALFSTGSDAMKVTAILVDNFDYMQLRTTRVDLCTDIALVKPMRGWLRVLRDDPDFEKTNSDANRKLTLIESSTGDTLYIGSRKSGRFGRIYDKSAAYGVGLGSVYRFEIETKKQVAPAIFKRLFPENMDSTFSWDNFGSECRKILQGQFFQWGVHLNLGTGSTERVKAECRISTADSQLEWLSRTVAPVLERLERAGYRQQAFDALGLPVVEFS